jgi:bifunctional UDP-N-acetylglucosamine pyrophosphorylase/glucosamine-1-phosphate N-acetyltransferase
MAQQQPKLHIVILAAGQGKRMHSELPKVLHLMGYKPLLAHVLDCTASLNPDTVHVVYGHGGDIVPQTLSQYDANWVLQAEQLGTGHAVMQALPDINDDATVLVLYGDVPLIRADTLAPLVADAATGKLAILTAVLDDASGYGRIVRDKNDQIQAIVEHKDANGAQLAIREINTGILAAPAKWLKEVLSRIRNSNAQGEYYLTDIIALAVADGMAVSGKQPQDVVEILGINSKQDLATMERQYQARQVAQLLDQGVTVRDPARLDIRGNVLVGTDVEIDVNVIFEGSVSLADNVKIGANCIIRNSRIGDDCEIHPNSLIEDSEMGRGCQVGPYARLRPGASLYNGAKVGNFVEVKKSTIGERSKVNHLSYIGDTVIGNDTNIGAGTITCNYDGANKHQTIIGDNVFIGSDVQLVAPVIVANGATIGAGSTVTRDVPEGKLSLSRTPLKTIDGWERPQKKKKGS